jgi:hypothetical protein
MRKSFYIVKLFNNDKIQKIDLQPMDGFETELAAENHLIKLGEENSLYYSWDSFLVLAIYHVIK